MGRPLNKKFFGGRNAGVTGNFNEAVDSTAKLSGQLVASVGSITAGTYTAAPTLQFPVPLGGEGITAARATGTPVFTVVSATISGGTGYGNAQTFNLTVNTAAGTAVLNVTSNSSGALVTVNSVTTGGTFTGISAVTSVSGGTGTGGTPVLTYGLSGATITDPGAGYSTQTSTTGITGTTVTTNTVTVQNVDGLAPGAKFVVTGTTIGNLAAGTYYILSVVDSTHVTLATSYANYFTATVMTQTTATGTMTGVASQNLGISISGGTGSGGAMSAVLSTAVSSGYTGRYKGILASANVGGTIYEDVDIIKQENSHSYRVLTSSVNTYPGTLCKLVGAAPTTAGTMAINATDSAGGTYWVYKITNRKAYLIRNTGTQFANYQAVSWNFTTPVANVSVTVDNS